MRNNGKDAEEAFLSRKRTKPGTVIERFWDQADLRGRNGGRAVGDFPKPSDFLITEDGNIHYAEVKSVQSGISFPFSNIERGQRSAALRQVQVGGDYASIVQRMEDPRTVMVDFANFAAATGPKRCWAKPLSFDYPFIDSYYKMFGMMMPFHYRTSRDLNTYIAGRAGGVDHVDMGHIESNGAAHDALGDVVYQLKMLFAAKAGDFGQPGDGIIDVDFVDVPA